MSLTRISTSRASRSLGGLTMTCVLIAASGAPAGAAAAGPAHQSKKASACKNLQGKAKRLCRPKHHTKKHSHG